MAAPWIRRTVAIVLLVATVLPASAARAVASSQAQLLTPRFRIDRGAAFTNSTNVRIGDGGRSPFFRPGVLVWDGGSIVGGCGGGPGMGFSEQTMRLVPHPCLSYESPSWHARITDMLTEARMEVDARYDPRGDQNVCVVLAGGGDIERGRSPSRVYGDLVRYCSGRRAAGFHVVVVTLLPRRTPLRFEADRQRFNELVRAGWSDFADGLADVAADPRIGDDGDQFHRRYYRPDAIHPNAAGYGVMAAVTAPVLNAFEWESAGCWVRFANDEGEWTDWATYAASRDWLLTDGDGLKTVRVEYRDRSGSVVGASDVIGLDTGRPVTTALRRASVRRGARASLSFSVTDPEPSCGTADVMIRIRTRGGRLVKTIKRHDRPTNVDLTVRLTCRLPSRVYRYCVTATDAAGNRAATAASKLIVR